MLDLMGPLGQFEGLEIIVILHIFGSFFKKLQLCTLWTSVLLFALPQF